MTIYFHSDKQVLLIGGTSFLQTRNHRIHHLAACLKAWEFPLDIISQVNFYTGPPAPRWRRLLRGSRAMFHKRIQIDKDRMGSSIIVRRLPGALGNLFQDFWTYLLVKPILERRYKICIIGHPRNAFLEYMIKKNGFAGSLIYDDWDYFPGHISTAYNPMESRVLQWRERVCIKYSDVVLSVSTSLAELRKSQGAKEVMVVPNGVPYGFFAKAQGKKPHPPTLIFMGSLYIAWGIDLVIQSIPTIQLKIPDIRFIILGSGPDEGLLRSLAYDELKLKDSVFFLGEQKYQDLPSFLSQADLGVLTYRDEPFTQYASSLKVNEYMAAGLPVIGTQVGDSAKLIQEYQAGLVVDFTPESFSQAVVQLLCDPGLYTDCVMNAKRCAEAYDWERVLKPVKDLLEILLEDKLG